MSFVGVALSPGEKKEKKTLILLLVPILRQPHAGLFCKWGTEHKGMGICIPLKQTSTACLQKETISCLTRSESSELS